MRRIQISFWKQTKTREKIENQYRKAVRGDEQRAQSKEITLRRSERKWKPSVKHGYVSYIAAEENSDEPATVEEAMISAERENGESDARGNSVITEKQHVGRSRSTTLSKTPNGNFTVLYTHLGI